MTNNPQKRTSLGWMPGAGELWARPSAVHPKPFARTLQVQPQPQPQGHAPARVQTGARTQPLTQAYPLGSSPGFLPAGQGQPQGHAPTQDRGGAPGYSEWQTQDHAQPHPRLARPSPVPPGYMQPATQPQAPLARPSPVPPAYAGYGPQGHGHQGYGHQGHAAVSDPGLHAAAAMRSLRRLRERSSPPPIQGANATAGVSQRARFIRLTYLFGAILVFTGLLYLLM